MRGAVPNRRMLFRRIRPYFKTFASVLFLMLYVCYSRNTKSVCTNTWKIHRKTAICSWPLFKPLLLYRIENFWSPWASTVLVRSFNNSVTGTHTRLATSIRENTAPACHLTSFDLPPGGYVSGTRMGLFPNGSVSPCQSPFRLASYSIVCSPRGGKWNIKSRFTHSMPCPCRVHVVPLPCRAAPLPCSDSAVSFVKVRVVAGNTRTDSPTV
jgi:hypothetical protein